ncbi:MAG TPA: helix-hairpin-helix domain-containing protein [Actinocrinis sp.]|jgi:exodeoxyribonuclease V alpha subunit
MTEGGAPSAGAPEESNAAVRAVKLAEAASGTGTAEAADETQPAAESAGSPASSAEPDDAAAVERLAGWLASAGAPAEYGERITAALGRSAAGRVAEDPWCVLEVPGVGPQAADALAGAIAGTGAPEAEDRRRTRALIAWLVRRAAAGGSTAQTASAVAAALGDLAVADAAGAIADAIDAGAVLAFAVPVSLGEDAGAEQMEDFEELDAADDDDPASMLTGERTLLAVERWAFAEQAVAEAAQRLAATPQPLDRADGPAHSNTDSADATREPAPEQLVDAFAAGGLSLATGTTAAMLAALAGAFPGALIASPSAAGLRTLAAAGAEPVDARGLSADPQRLAQAPALILADAQLLDLELGSALLEGAAEGAHVLLAGDPATLPAAAPGLLFRDLLELDEPEFGGRLPRVEVKHRPIGPRSALADSVRHGGLPPQELLQSPEGTPPEVMIVPVREPAEAVHRAVQLATQSIPRAFGLTANDIQVVAVAAAGPAGAAELNAAVKAELNAGPGICGGFDPADRVVAAAPLPEHGLHGGETGTVEQADPDGLTVLFDEPHAGLVKLEGAQAAKEALRHAWALTAAEAQGGRWPAVVAVFDGATAQQLTRAQVLGAFTLATRHISVVHGAGRHLSEAVESRPDRPRVTRLRHALRD